MRAESHTDRGSERPPAYDAAVLADLEAVFGRARLDKLLDGLAGEIAGRFGAPATDLRRLGDDAHVLTSVSGTLGFAPLSRACAVLERACLEGADPSEPLLIVQIEAERAGAALVALRASA